MNRSKMKRKEKNGILGCKINVSLYYGDFVLLCSGDYESQGYSGPQVPWWGQGAKPLVGGPGGKAPRTLKKFCKIKVSKRIFKVQNVINYIILWDMGY